MKDESAAISHILHSLSTIDASSFVADESILCGLLTVVLSFPTASTKKKFVLTKETKKEKKVGWFNYFSALWDRSAISCLSVMVAGMIGRNAITNGSTVCTIKKHAHLNWGTQVDLWMSLSIFSWPVTRILHVWGRRQTKSKTERRALLLQPQLCTHTHYNH